MLTLKIASFFLVCSAGALIGVAFGLLTFSEKASTHYAKIGIGLLMATVFLFLVSLFP